jgi:hypothetical protein
MVQLDNGAGQLRGRVDTELKLRLLSIVRRQTLQQQSPESGPGTTSEGMENEKTLETGTVIWQTKQLIHHRIDELFSDGVVSTGIWVDVET